MKKRTPLRLDMPGYDPRDFVGYGRNPPHPQWPGGARIAVQIALNYEAGGEHNILYGDAHSEGVLVDAPLPAVPGKRLLATIEDSAVARRILSHLGLPTECPEPLPARSPPNFTGLFDSQLD
jgi:hypothetical protein